MSFFRKFQDPAEGALQATVRSALKDDPTGQVVLLDGVLRAPTFLNALSSNHGMYTSYMTSRLSKIADIACPAAAEAEAASKGADALASFWKANSVADDAQTAAATLMTSNSTISAHMLGKVESKRRQTAANQEDGERTVAQQLCGVIDRFCQLVDAGCAVAVDSCSARHAIRILTCAVRQCSLNDPPSPVGSKSKNNNIDSASNNNDGGAQRRRTTSTIIPDNLGRGMPPVVVPHNQSPNHQQQQLQTQQQQLAEPESRSGSDDDEREAAVPTVLDAAALTSIARSAVAAACRDFPESQALLVAMVQQSAACADAVSHQHAEVYGTGRTGSVSNINVDIDIFNGASDERKKTTTVVTNNTNNNNNNLKLRAVIVALDLASHVMSDITPQSRGAAHVARFVSYVFAGGDLSKSELHLKGKSVVHEAVNIYISLAQQREQQREQQHVQQQQQQSSSSISSLSSSPSGIVTPITTRRDAQDEEQQQQSARELLAALARVVAHREFCPSCRYVVLPNGAVLPGVTDTPIIPVETGSTCGGAGAAWSGYIKASLTIEEDEHGADDSDATASTKRMMKKSSVPVGWQLFVDELSSDLGRLVQSAPFMQLLLMQNEEGQLSGRGCKRLDEIMFALRVSYSFLCSSRLATTRSAAISGRDASSEDEEKQSPAAARVIDLFSTFGGVHQELAAASSSCNNSTTNMSLFDDLKRPSSASEKSALARTVEETNDIVVSLAAAVWRLAAMFPHSSVLHSQIVVFAVNATRTCTAATAASERLAMRIFSGILPLLKVHFAADPASSASTSACASASFAAASETTAAGGATNRSSKRERAAAAAANVELRALCIQIFVVMMQTAIVDRLRPSSGSGESNIMDEEDEEAGQNNNNSNETQDDDKVLRRVAALFIKNIFPGLTERSAVTKSGSRRSGGAVQSPLKPVTLSDIAARQCHQRLVRSLLRYCVGADMEDDEETACMLSMKTEDVVDPLAAQGASSSNNNNGGAKSSSSSAPSAGLCLMLDAFEGSNHDDSNNDNHVHFDANVSSPVIAGHDSGVKKNKFTLELLDFDNPVMNSRSTKSKGANDDHDQRVESDLAAAMLQSRQLGPVSHRPVVRIPKQQTATSAMRNDTPFSSEASDEIVSVHDKSYGSRSNGGTSSSSNNSNSSGAADAGSKQQDGTKRVNLFDIDGEDIDADGSSSGGGNGGSQPLKKSAPVRVADPADLDDMGFFDNSAKVKKPVAGDASSSASAIGVPSSGARDNNASAAQQQHHHEQQQQQNDNDGESPILVLCESPLSPSQQFPAPLPVQQQAAGSIHKTLTTTTTVQWKPSSGTIDLFSSANGASAGNGGSIGASATSVLGAGVPPSPPPPPSASPAQLLLEEKTTTHSSLSMPTAAKPAAIDLFGTAEKKPAAAAAAAAIILPSPALINDPEDLFASPLSSSSASATRGKNYRNGDEEGGGGGLLLVVLKVDDGFKQLKPASASAAAVIDLFAPTAVEAPPAAPVAGEADPDIVLSASTSPQMPDFNLETIDLFAATTASSSRQQQQQQQQQQTLTKDELKELFGASPQLDTASISSAAQQQHQKQQSQPNETQQHNNNNKKKKKSVYDDSESSSSSDDEPPAAPPPRVAKPQPTFEPVVDPYGDYDPFSVAPPIPSAASQSGAIVSDGAPAHQPTVDLFASPQTTQQQQSSSLSSSSTSPSLFSTTIEIESNRNRVSGASKAEDFFGATSAPPSSAAQQRSLPLFDNTPIVPRAAALNPQEHNFLFGSATPSSPAAAAVSSTDVPPPDLFAQRFGSSAPLSSAAVAAAAQHGDDNIDHFPLYDDSSAHRDQPQHHLAVSQLRADPRVENLFGTKMLGRAVPSSSHSERAPVSVPDQVQQASSSASASRSKLFSDPLFAASANTMSQHELERRRAEDSVAAEQSRRKQREEEEGVVVAASPEELQQKFFGGGVVKARRGDLVSVKVSSAMRARVAEAAMQQNGAGTSSAGGGGGVTALFDWWADKAPKSSSTQTRMQETVAVQSSGSAHDDLFGGRRSLTSGSSRGDDDDDHESSPKQDNGNTRQTTQRNGKEGDDDRLTKKEIDEIFGAPGAKSAVVVVVGQPVVSPFSVFV